MKVTKHKQQTKRKVHRPSVCSKDRRCFPKVWNELRECNQFCDGVIESSEGHRFRVHRVILAASSGYFKALFTSVLAPDPPFAKLNFSTDVLRSLIGYCYTGQCTVTQENVEKLLPAADHLEIMGVLETCCAYLENQISYSNCWGIFKYAEAYSCHYLAETAKSYLFNHFVEFSLNSQEFLELELSCLSSILQDDLINASDEKHVFQAADRWLKYDLYRRETHAGVLFSAIRFGFIDYEYFLGCIICTEYIGFVPQKLLWEAKVAIESKQRGKVNYNDPHLTAFLRPRIPNEILFCIGGWSAGSPTNYIETYNTITDQWLSCHVADRIPRSYHGTVCLDSLIYVIGGFDGNVHFNTVRCFDTERLTWYEKACMHQARCYVCCVYLDGYIYAIGGYNGRSRMSSVERYNIKLNQWEMISPMNHMRSDAGATVCGNKIYVAGGFNGQEVLTSAEVYDPAVGRWLILPNLNVPRSGVSLCMYSDEVYALGGFDTLTRLNSVEKLNPSHHPLFWDHNIPNMITQRSNFASVVVNDRMYIVGGFDGSATTALCECYNGTFWTPIRSMNLNRSALAVCVCKGLKNSRYFTQITPQNQSNNATGDAMITY